MAAPVGDFGLGMCIVGGRRTSRSISGRMIRLWGRRMRRRGRLCCEWCVGSEVEKEKERWLRVERVLSYATLTLCRKCKSI